MTAGSHEVLGMSSGNAWKRFWSTGGWWKALGIAVLYLALYEGSSFLVTWIFRGALDADNILGTPSSVFVALALPVIIGSILLLVFAWSIDWIPRPIFAKQPITGKWWMWIAPILVVATILLRVFGTDYGPFSIGVIVTILLAGIFIGLSEELLTRGIAVTALRARGYSEWVVMVLSSVIFAVLHSVNFFAGQPVLTVLLTLLFTFGFGICMYLTLRVTGNLIWPILLHAATDPTTILATGGIDVLANKNPSPLLTIAGTSTIVFLLFAVIALIFVRGRVATTPVPHHQKDS